MHTISPNTFAAAGTSRSGSTLPAHGPSATAEAAAAKSTAESTAAAAIVNLPASAGNVGRVYVVKHSTASQNTVTVDADGAELIDGNANVVLNARGVCRVQSTGTGWIVV